LLPAISAHHDLLAQLLQDLPAPQVRQSLAAAAGGAAMLEGWLAFLLDDRRGARARWAYADVLAQEIGDMQLHAHVLIARSSLASSLPHGGGESQMAVSLLDEAQRCAGTSPPLQAWLLARRAEEHAAMGRSRESVRDITAAERWLRDDEHDGQCLPGPGSELDLSGFKGNCTLLLGRDREAADVLARAANAAAPARTTLRAVLLNDLGAALARLGEVDDACAAFMESLDLVDETGAAVHAQRVAGAAKHLGDRRDVPAVALLDERLRQLA
jgi:hypothetical protein